MNWRSDIKNIPDGDFLFVDIGYSTRRVVQMSMDDNERKYFEMASRNRHCKGWRWMPMPEVPKE